MSTHVPKAVLYYFPSSIWASSALIALEEKGYGEDELELKVVDLDKAENLSLTYLRINPKGTVPTLVVPLAKTLAPQDEHRYKAVTDTKSVIELLDKSRSAVSRTHTTSPAPAPALAPATIALSSTSNTIIDLLHSNDGDPSLLAYHSALDLAALRAAAPALTPTLAARRDALTRFAADSHAAPVAASERTRRLWAERLAETSALLGVYADAGTDAAALGADGRARRDEFFATAHALWHVRLRNVLTVLDKEIVGPFALGDQLSIADIHLAPWLARLVLLSGGAASDDGDAIVARLEAKVGNDFAFPKDFQATAVPDEKVDPALAVTPGAKRVKLAAFWDEMKVRPSWKKVYAAGLH